MGLRFSELVIDCLDPGTVAAFWAAALGVPLPEPDSDGDIVLRVPGQSATWLFGHVPEPKAVKDRLHIDLSPAAPDEQQAEVERLLALGATRADVGQRDDVGWVVLADPEGNELCVLRGDG